MLKLDLEAKVSDVFDIQFISSDLLRVQSCHKDTSGKAFSVDIYEEMINGRRELTPEESIVICMTGRRDRTISGKMVENRSNKFRSKCLEIIFEEHCKFLKSIPQSEAWVSVLHNKCWHPDFELDNIMFLNRNREYEKNSSSQTLISGNVGSFLELVSRLKEDSSYWNNQIIDQRTIPTVAPILKSFSSETFDKISKELIQLLRDINGIELSRLYSHQVFALERVLEGKNVVVCTPTSSGKSLIYNLAVLNSICGDSDSDSTALYIFPTKALAQDQLLNLRKILPHGIIADEFCCAYDGDTPGELRSEILSKSRILFTNPDMIHKSLSGGTLFKHFLNRLEFIVVDEMHVYRGNFGAHVANVMMRLSRILTFPSRVKFICCSATIANPSELAKKLFYGFGAEFHVISESGAPTKEKHFILWNPPLLRKKPSSSEIFGGFRKSANFEAAELLVRFVEWGLRTIVFCKSREACERILEYSHNLLRSRKVFPDASDRISSYRGGYSIATRRKIEHDFFHGNLLGIISTNALELGIDVGGLDVVIQVGFPSSISSFWQQAGRAGRSSSRGQNFSLNVVVGQETPIDQFYMRNPDKLFSKSAERVLINPFCPQLLHEHLQCASFEHPLHESEDILHLPAISAHLRRLGRLSPTGLWTLIPQADSSLQDLSSILSPEDLNPAHRLSLRNSPGPRIRLMDAGSKEILDDNDERGALLHFFPGSVLQIRRRFYVVNELSFTHRLAVASRITEAPALRTRAVSRSMVRTLAVSAQRTVAGPSGLVVCYGTVQATTEVSGFRRVSGESRAVADEVPLALPRVEVETQAVWLALGSGRRRGTHALLHALRVAAGSEVLGAEVEVELVMDCEGEEGARMLMWDRAPGGSGFSRMCWEEGTFEAMLRAAGSLIRGCHCAENSGCPECVLLNGCSMGNREVDKQAALELLGSIIGFGS